MNCKNCGFPLTENDQFCKNCGAAVYAQSGQVNVQQPMNNYQQVQTQQPMSYQQTQMQQPNNNIQQDYTNNNQNSWQNSYNQVPNSQPEKTNNNVKYIVIGIVIVAVIFGGIFAFKLFGNNGGINSNIAASKFYKVNFRNFTLNIPDDMIYEIANDELILGDEDGTWVVEFMIADGSFNQVKNNKNQLQGYFQQNGFTAQPAEIKTISNTEFVTIEMSHTGTNFIGAYAKLNSMKAAWMVAYNQDNEFDYELLKKMATIVSTAIYDDSTNSISTTSDFNFNIDEISQFGK